MDNEEAKRKIEEYRRQIEEELKGRIETTKNKDIRRKLELDYLNERENILKQERLRIQKEQKWYKKPQNIIPLLGVILPLIVSLIVSLSNQDTKELSILYTSPESLISSESDMRGNLYVRYDSSEISNISKFTIEIINTGEKTITKDDFIDGPISFVISCNNNPNLNILKVIRKDDANQQKSELLFDSNSKNTFQYLPSLINKNDKIVLDVFLPNSPAIQFKSFGKIVEGKINGPVKIKENEITLGFKTFVLSINSFFKYKWITTIILIILSIFTGLASLFQFMMVYDGDLDPPVLGIFMGLSTSFISLFSLLLTIFVLIY